MLRTLSKEASKIGCLFRHSRESGNPALFYGDEY
jgi:hypothetical protein